MIFHEIAEPIYPIERKTASSLPIIIGFYAHYKKLTSMPNKNTLRHPAIDVKN
jgi:hypothetical protein